MNESMALAAREQTAVSSFIVHAFLQVLPDGGDQIAGTRLACLGRCDDGRTVAAVFDPYRPSFFIRRSDSARARDLIAAVGVDAERVDRTAATAAMSAMTAMDGEPVTEFAFRTLQRARRADTELRTRGIRTYEADLAGPDRAFIDAGIHGSVRLEGAARAGSAVDLVFVNPAMAPGEWEPRLEVVSIDIETDPGTGQILAVALVSNGAWVAAANEVHFLGPQVQAMAGGSVVTAYEREEDLLAAVVRRIREIDPDIITGWNVIDFDLRSIGERLVAHRLPFAIARSAEPARFLPATRAADGARQNAGVSCQGRQVIDALRLVRYGPRRFDDRRLGAVAAEVLGETKTVEAATSAEKIRSLLALYRDDPRAFCEYCRTDAELVLRILEKTGLLELTIRRSRLIGISLNRAWTSVAAFEFLYVEAMHRRGLVAPSLGVDRLPQGEVAGGAILRPEPGLYSGVLVFDFKSLYPSIIRTFGIDPVAYLDTEEGYPEGVDPPPPGDAVTAPNGARFARGGGILPEIIDRFWTEREEAKKRGDPVASYVYKIVMNSFYGVLGTPGCRFAGAPLAGAITGFGQYLLHWAQARLTDLGHRVLYGDTDSLFVLPAPCDRLFELGRHLCGRINEELAGFVGSRFGLECRMELEFEKVYARFYLPRLRHGPGADEGEVHGRAKGYAGLELNEDGSEGRLEIKGMEAIRSDWTAAAARLQEELLAMLFAGSGSGALVEHVEGRVAALRSGRLDEDLVYARRLRKPVGAYTRNRPPHVQAAVILPREEQEGVIEYVVTVEGPQPVALRTAAIDHEHYVERQIRPIAEPILEVAGVAVGQLFDAGRQLSLF